MVKSYLKSAAVLAGILGFAGLSEASMSDWHVTPGGTSFSTGQYANWTPYGGTNLNNSTAATNGAISGVTYSVWDSYGPHGNAGNGGNLNSFGGQEFDIKALYMRSDATKFYIGLVTGFNPAGTVDPYNSAEKLSMGDLAINSTFAQSTAAYGIKTIAAPVGSSGSTKTYAGGTWSTPNANIGFSGAPYSSMTTLGSLVGSDATYSYSSTGVSYWDSVTNSNVPIDLLEFSVPRSEIGASANGTTISLDWAMTCENDAVHATYTFPSSGGGIPVPEPATIGVMVVAGMIAVARGRKQRVR